MPLITREFHQRAPLDYWQDEFYSLYGHIDADLHLYDIMLQIVADASRIAEAMRRGEYSVALPYIPRVFSWLCSLTSKCRLNRDKFGDLSTGRRLSEIIWEKYPNLCYFCAQPRCMCPAIHVDGMTAEERSRQLGSVHVALEQARASRERPITLDEWVEMFERVYGAVNAARSSAEKTFHFLEEVGEVEIELRKADRILNGLPISGEERAKGIQLEPEIADVFSWLVSVYLHMRGFHTDLNKLVKTFELVPGFEATHDAPIRLKPLLSFSSWVWAVFGNHETGIGLRCHRCGCGEEPGKCCCRMIRDRR